MAYLIPLAGGAMIGLAAAILWLASGRVAGVSGIASGLVPPVRGDVAWRLAFLIGLVGGGALLAWLLPGRFELGHERSLLALAGAGVLVGVGTRVGGGCTSGHGVCGVGRMSPRSLIATTVFVAVGMATVAIVRLAGGRG